MATPTLGRGSDGNAGRRGKMGKVGLALFVFLGLLYAGSQGRKQAEEQLSLLQITSLRDELQQKVDDQSGSLAEFFEGALQNRPQALTEPARGLVESLKTQLGQFESTYSRSPLSDFQELEIRLSQATVANAERKFAAALNMVTEQDEKRRWGKTEAESDCVIRVLQVRGDSLYGLGEWQPALNRYEQILGLRRDCRSAIGRKAGCLYALGKVDQALSACAELAKLHTEQGNVLLLEGNSEASIIHYEKAIEIQNWLVEKKDRKAHATELASSHNAEGDALLIQGKAEAAAGQYAQAIAIQTRFLEQQPATSNLVSKLALSHADLGNAFLIEEKPQEAVGHYGKAVELLTTLGEEPGRAELTGQLATIHANLGSALIGEQNLDGAIAHYEKAIGLQTRLIDQDGSSELRNDLAMSYNNCGAVRRAQGKLDAAIEDFGNAIRILTRLTEQAEQGSLSRRYSQEQRPQSRLDVAIDYSEKNIEVSSQPRLTPVGRKDFARNLALALKNSGFAHLARGQPKPALEEFKNSAKIYTRLFEEDGQSALSLELAMSLNAIAWIYATNPDGTLRNGLIAKQYANKACALTEWKALGPVETLAAAYAETGDFAEALRWQQKAIELAPPEADKTELRGRAQLYRTGAAYRAPIPKPG